MTTKWKVAAFGPGDPLDALPQTKQVEYLRCYLDDLGCSAVLEEPRYFDRDYLAEYAAFYSTTTRPYGNVCRRLHFFAGGAFKRDHLRRLLAGRERTVARARKNYLGFSVIRPIPSAPLGRTVLRWYPDATPETPRVIEPAREYAAHLAGLRLSVRGLAWQQQDTGVGACATIALWSMLHSSAFDDHYAIPTTAAITQFAHRRASLGHKVFPSSGLTFPQVLEAIKECGLSPEVCEGEVQTGGTQERGFNKARFASLCAALIRSGYPVLILGPIVGGGRHAVCAVGFREAAAPSPADGVIHVQDADTKHLYVHDDNLGPNVRFEIIDLPNGVCGLRPSRPPAHGPRRPFTDPGISYGVIRPEILVTAVHQDLRTGTTSLHRVGQKAAAALQSNLIVKATNARPGITFSARFSKLADYMGRNLEFVLGYRPELLARVRLRLVEQVPPMSLRIGVVRIGLLGTPAIDILYDTTDSERHLSPFCSIAFHRLVEDQVEALQSSGAADYGVLVSGY